MAPLRQTCRVIKTLALINFNVAAFAFAYISNVTAKLWDSIQTNRNEGQSHRFSRSQKVSSSSRVILASRNAQMRFLSFSKRAWRTKSRRNIVIPHALNKYFRRDVAKTRVVSAVAAPPIGFVAYIKCKKTVVMVVRCIHTAGRL